MDPEEDDGFGLLSEVVVGGGLGGLGSVYALGFVARKTDEGDTGTKN